MTDIPLLSLTIFLPLLGALVILLIKSQKELAADAETKGYKVTYF